MREQKSEPSDEIKAGRRALEGLSQVHLVEDLTWSESESSWVLQCHLTADIERSATVPRSTNWYILLPRSYPFGEIRFFPAKDAGLQATFPHQSLNLEGEPDLPWRTGKLCLGSQIGTLRRLGFDDEPFAVSERLKWHVDRALEWLRLAGEGALRRDGDPFELPDYNAAVEKKIIFIEDLRSLGVWQSNPARFGFAQFKTIKRKPRKVLLAESFEDTAGKLVHKPAFKDWNEDRSHEPELACWMRVDTVPVIEPWQAPVTWDDLRRWLRTSQNEDLFGILRRLFGRLRDMMPHLLLLGFPIPAVVGEDSASRLHWLAIQLPILASSAAEVPSGFRSNEVGLWKADERALKTKNRLLWVSTECWNEKEISGRGRLEIPLRSRAIFLIGAGALGSIVSEILVRGGVRSLTVVDSDRLKAGNLVRHSLSLEEIEEKKAAALARRLNSLSPFAEVVGSDASFPDLDEAMREKARKADIVIDCTASEEVTFRLSQFGWGAEKLFASLSLGLGAKRLYCYTTWSGTFPVNDYWDTIRPLIEEDLRNNPDLDLPREGVGCWNPVFPARAGEVWMMAGTAVRSLEEASKTMSGPHLDIFEQRYEQHRFVGTDRRTVKGASHA